MPPPADGRACRRPRARAPPPSTCPSCVNRIFGRAGAARRRRRARRRSRRPSSRSRCGPGGRSGSPTTSPAAAAGRPGSRRAIAAAPPGWRTRRSRSSGAGAGGGELPVVIDATSCTHGLIESAALLSERRPPSASRELEIVDSIEWAPRRCCRTSTVGRAGRRRRRRPPDLLRRASLGARRARSRELAGALADEVVVPTSAGCCGFAGDRGFLHPELTASATAAEARRGRRPPTATHTSARTGPARSG